MKEINNENGFTLTELIFSILLIGIISMPLAIFRRNNEEYGNLLKERSHMTNLARNEIEKMKIINDSPEEDLEEKIKTKGDYEIKIEIANDEESNSEDGVLFKIIVKNEKYDNNEVFLYKIFDTN